MTIPLPLPAKYPDEGVSGVDYTADQMRAYGDARAADERERCVFDAEQAYIDGRGAKGVIDAIRAGS